MRKQAIDGKSIRIKFWIYFSILVVFILLLLWLLQIVFINSFYQSMKTQEIEKIGQEIVSEFGQEDFQETVLSYSFEKGVNIQILDGFGRRYFPLEPIDVFQQPALRKDDYDKYILPLIKGNLASSTYLESIGDTGTSSILHVAYLGEEANDRYYLMVNTILDPVDTTVDVLVNILLIVSVIAMFLAFGLAYFLSNRLAAPLTNMAKTARQLGQGDYDVSFEKGDYTEINDLARTLNYAKEELTKTIEVRKDLIANVSHDLKTPLTVIKSYGEMIRDISGDNRDLRNKHIDTILQETDYLTEFVNDLLDLSRVESELEDLNKRPFDLVDLAKKTLERFELLKKKDGYQLDMEAPKTCIILGDKDKIRQVIYNFISNAINYSRDRKYVLLKITQKKTCVRLSVIDHGIGIPADKLEDIWDRYFRARDNYERQVVGTGLGLHICKTILELHDFNYGVISQEGRGSEFYFEVPLYDEN
ncbi:MAG: HAMP domain-containing sensor histidine kinase [Tissierellia bacterium]|nr:HAMP domain-containing sensor histidine kinase [Tissierellia bacterium]